MDTCISPKARGQRMNTTTTTTTTTTTVRQQRIGIDLLSRRTENCKMRLAYLLLHRVLGLQVVDMVLQVF